MRLLVDIVNVLSVAVLSFAGLVTVLSFGAGLARPKFGRAPPNATAAIIAGYVILLIVVPGIVSVAHADYAIGIFFLTYFLAGWFALLQVALVWTGGWLSTVIWKQQEPLHLEVKFMLALAVYFATLVLLTALIVSAMGNES